MRSVPLDTKLKLYYRRYKKKLKSDLRAAKKENCYKLKRLKIDLLCLGRPLANTRLQVVR